MDYPDKNNKEDEKAVHNIVSNATQVQQVNETHNLESKIKIEIKAELGESLIREGLKLLAWYISRKGDNSLRSELQNLINTDEIKTGENRDRIPFHEVGPPFARNDSQLPRTTGLPPQDTKQPSEKDLVSEKVFVRRSDTRRTFLSLAGLIVVILIGWLVIHKAVIQSSGVLPLPDSLLRYAIENKLSSQQINKLRYFSERGFKTNDSISYFTFLEQYKVEPYVFDSIPSTLEFQTYKRYFDHLKLFVPSDHLLENLNPIIAYGIEKKFSLLELESLCKAFTQHHFRDAIFHAIRNNRQLFDGLFKDFVEMEKDSIQYYIDVLHGKAKTSPTWDRTLLAMTEKIRIMEAIRDYKKEDLGIVMISKERAARIMMP